MYLQTTATIDTLNGYFTHCAGSVINYYDNLYYVLSQNRFCSHCGCEHTFFISREKAKAELKHAILNTPILEKLTYDCLISDVGIEYDVFLEKYFKNSDLPSKIIAQQSSVKLLKHDYFVELIYEIANDFKIIGKRMTFSDILDKA